MRVLLIEDHSELRTLVAEHLRRRGYAVDPVARLHDASAALACGEPYEAVVLDLGLPDGDGMDLLRRLRKSPETAPPVLVLTARDSLADRVAGLDAGADDYLLKPFELAELDARLRAILRRPGGRTGAHLRLGDLSFDSATRCAQVVDVQLDLPRRETALLETLLRARQRVVVKDVLETTLYSADEPVTANAVEACVSRLRKKLDVAGSACRVETHRGIGYALVHAETE